MTGRKKKKSKWGKIKKEHTKIKSVWQKKSRKCIDTRGMRPFDFTYPIKNKRHMAFFSSTGPLQYCAVMYCTVLPLGSVL